MAKEGARVGVTARSTAELEEVLATIRSSGGQAFAIPADLSERTACPAVVKTLLDHWGPIEILVNNAGVGSSANPKPAVDFDDDFWDLTLRLNLTAPYLLSKAVLPPMLKARWGRIINIASINSRIGSLHGAAYAATKHGLLGLTRTLAMEVAAAGITVNAICPGPVRSVMSDRRVAYDAERLGLSSEKLEQSLTPMGRRLEPEEIAPLAVFLASDDARAITGQGYNVCGGVNMA